MRMLQSCPGRTPDSAVVNVLLPVKNPTTPLNIAKMICTSNERIRMVPWADVYLLGRYPESTVKKEWKSVTGIRGKTLKNLG